MKPKKPHNRIGNLGTYAHPPKSTKQVTKSMVAAATKIPKPKAAKLQPGKRKKS